MSKLSEAQIEKLMKASRDMKDKAYCTISNFRVGAALMTSDGTVFTGCNVENASCGLTICAERSAVVKAVSEGYREFKAIAVASDMRNEHIAPCGACRQVLVEFGKDIDVYMTKPDMTYKVMTIGDLLPMSFGASALQQERITIDGAGTKL